MSQLNRESGVRKKSQMAVDGFFLSCQDSLEKKCWKERKNLCLYAVLLEVISAEASNEEPRSGLID